MSETRPIQLDRIVADVNAQPRVSLLTDKIGEYVEDMQRGDEFPPLVVFQEGSTYWLADGFHRYYAAQTAQLSSFACLVQRGGLREAILYSCGANAAHGLRRSIQDKRRAIAKLLDDEEWSKWSDYEIAKQCSVSHEFVRKARKFISGLTSNDASDNVRVYRDKHGNESEMVVAHIGRREPEPEQPLDPRFVADAIALIERTFDKLPAPEIAAEVFPADKRYLFPPSKLINIAGWLYEFAEAMKRELAKNAQAVAAQ